MHVKFKTDIDAFLQTIDCGDVKLIGLVDMDGITRYASDDHTEITGWGIDELLGHSNVDKIHPEDLSRFIVELHEKLRTGSNGPVKYRYKHKNGGWIESATHVRLLKRDGIAHGIVLVSHPDPAFDFSCVLNKINVEWIIDRLELFEKANQA